MKIKDIQESTVAGSIASVAKPLGELQTRSKPEKAPKVTKGKKYANTISEGAVKELLYNLKHMDADEFQKVYKKTKDFFQKTDKPAQAPKPTSVSSTKGGSQVWHDTGYTDKKIEKAQSKSVTQTKDEPIQEDELKEEDLIILPGMLRGKDKSFISKQHDRRDHEVEMARSDVYAAAKDAMRIFKILEARTEDEGLMGWQQSYITLASDYLNSVADSLEYDNISNEGVASKIITKLAQRGAKDLPKTPEVQRAIANRAIGLEKNLGKAVTTGTAAAGGVAGKEIYDKAKKSNEGVIAGGMSNFEEGRYYDPMGDERREQQAMDDERRDFKRREMEYELRGEEEAVRRANEGPWYVRIDGKLVRDKNKDPYVFNTLEAARKAAQTMMKKDWNKGKQFSYTRTMNENTAVTEGKFFQSNFTFAKDSPLWQKTIKGGTGTREDPFTAGFGSELEILAQLMKSFALQMADLDPRDPRNFGPTPNKLYYKFNNKLYMGDGTNKIMPAQEGVAEGSLNELSPETLARYKKAAGADASKADKEGDFKRGNKRFSGIVRATKKEFDKKQADEKNKKDVTEEKCNECGGVAYADESIAEEKDACYNKVKSRYKVWPSAYASGALSKCRKVGASNWGNKSKK